MNIKSTQRKLELIPIVTIILVAINVLVFLVTDAMNMKGSYYLIEHGALGYDPVLNHHELHRLLTHMFLHADEEHLLNNMLMLAVLGYYMEEYMGHLRFLILYFCTGFIAACTSMVYNMMHMYLTPSIGASGAIYGLLGSYIFLVWHLRQQQQSVDPRRLLLAVAICFYGGVNSQEIDVMAHAGGFLSGMPCAALLNLTRNKKGRKKK
ncbi:MAG: rhomboid family intramembrane serine protease [Lachnospiraceae bacterium]|nr:rhomboid family intramembrane serine protease [Lachnospiraceae bacterium]